MSESANRLKCARLSILDPVPRAAVVASIACLGLVPAAPGAATAAWRPSLAVVVTREAGGDLLSVAARQASLRDLLAEVARRAGFELAEVLPLSGRPVSVVFDALPLERALRRLLAGESFALVYRTTPAGPGLSRVLLLGPRERPLRAPESERPDPAPGLSRGAGDDAAPPIQPEDAQGFDPDGPIEPLLVLAGHPDYRMRAMALEALSGRRDDPRARQALLDRALDPEPRVRNVVVGLLGPHLPGWPDAEEAVWSALRDVIGPIRGIALLALWEAGSPRAGEAVRLALEDADLGVRAMAEALARERAEAEPGGESIPGPGPAGTMREGNAPCRRFEVCP